MAILRAALLSLALLVAAPAGAQAPPDARLGSGAPGAEPAGPPPAVVRIQPPPPAVAPAPEQPLARIGFGASLGGNGSNWSLYLPVDFARLRVELEGAHDDLSSRGVRASSTRLGVGLFGLLPGAASVRSYWGARLQYLRQALAGSTTDGTRVAATLGAEWLPVPTVALAVEGQFGHSDRSGGGLSGSGFDSNAQVFLRVFFAAFTRDEGRSGGAAAAVERPQPPRVVKCLTSADCDGLGLCYAGFCRR